MDQKEQALVVNQALNLEIKLDGLRSELHETSTQSFKAAPPAPVREQFEAVYPKIESKVKFKWIIVVALWVLAGILSVFFQDNFLLVLVIGIVCLAAVFVYYASYKSKKNADIKRIAESDEYKAQCAKIDTETAAKQEAANESYEKSMKLYEAETLPKYQQELELWDSEHRARISEIESAIAQNELELSNVYDSSKIIPPQYRTIEALSFFDNLMSTSTFDIHRAIENYENKLNQALQVRNLEAQQEANRLAEEQNALLDEQNEIANKAYKAQVFADGVAAVQRHNSNKMWKEHLNKK